MNLNSKLSSFKRKLDSSLVKNLFWLLGDKIFRLGGGLLVGILVAKYLGPEQFGLFNFAFSFVWLFSYTVTLGLDEIVTRELIKFPEQKDKLLGTAIITKLLGGIVTFFIIGITIFFLRKGNQDVIIITLIMAVSMIIKNVGVFRLLYESVLQSKFNVYAESIGFIFVSLLRLFFIYIYAPLVYFVWALIFEVVASSLAFIYFYWKSGQRVANWRFDFTLAKQLINESWPLILSGVSIMIYVKIDQVMLGIMASNYETGIYSAAVRISELWYFIPVAIVTSYYPSLVKSKKISEVEYQNRFLKLFKILFYSALIVAIVFTLSSELIVKLLYGNDYLPSSIILSIHTWAGIFVVLGLASSKFFIIENLQKFYFYQTIIGALSNIILNLILIPKYASKGAAIATLISYGLSVFSCILFDKLNTLSKLLFHSFVRTKVI